MNKNSRSMVSKVAGGSALLLMATSALASADPYVSMIPVISGSPQLDLPYAGESVMVAPEYVPMNPEFQRAEPVPAPAPTSAEGSDAPAKGQTFFGHNYGYPSYGYNYGYPSYGYNYGYPSYGYNYRYRYNYNYKYGYGPYYASALSTSKPAGEEGAAPGPDGPPQQPNQGIPGGEHNQQVIDPEQQNQQQMQMPNQFSGSRPGLGMPQQGQRPQQPLNNVIKPVFVPQKASGVGASPSPSPSPSLASSEPPKYFAEDDN